MIVFQTKNKKHSMSIESMGCRVTELVLNQKKIFWSGIRPDGKPASTHPCLPNFGLITKGPLKALPQHGPARNQEWQLIKTSPLTYQWQMEPIDGFYPKGLVTIRQFELSEAGEFKFELILENQGRKSIRANPGEHIYFNCAYNLRKQVRINDTSVDPKSWETTIYLPLNQGENRLYIPTIGKLCLTVSRYTKCACWSVPNACFICIEPIGGEPNEIYDYQFEIKPGRTVLYALVLKQDSTH